MRKSRITIDVTPVRAEMLSARAYVKLVKESPERIKSSRVVPPKLGSRSFGAVWVEYTSPQYRLLNSAHAPA